MRTANVSWFLNGNYLFKSNKIATTGEYLQDAQLQCSHKYKRATE